jgi:hypothetical protein
MDHPTDGYKNLDLGCYIRHEDGQVYQWTTGYFSKAELRETLKSIDADCKVYPGTIYDFMEANGGEKLPERPKR